MYDQTKNLFSANCALVRWLIRTERWFWCAQFCLTCIQSMCLIHWMRTVVQHPPACNSSRMISHRNFFNAVELCKQVCISFYLLIYRYTPYTDMQANTHTHIRATMNEKINRLSSGLWSSNGLLIFIKSAKWNSNDKIALCSTKRKYAIRLKSIWNCDWNLYHAALCAVHKRFFFHLFFPSDLS